MPVWAQAEQAANSAAPLSVRAYWHNPSHKVAEFYLKDAKGGVAALNLLSDEIGGKQQTTPVDGLLVLYSTPTVDPKHPQVGIAASVAVPKNLKRAIVMIVPGKANSTPAWRMLLMDDSLAAFPKSESRVVTLTTLETVIEAGEHKLFCKPGSITAVPPVKTLNEYRMAQTNLYYKKNQSWIAFNECKMKYLDVFRQVFIVYHSPESTTPELTILVDQIPAPPK